MYRDACAFFLWGYDSGSPGVKAENLANSGRFESAYVQTMDSDGTPMACPIIYDGIPYPSMVSEPIRVVRGKWTIGSDPNEPTLLETTAYLSQTEAPRLALSPGERGAFFTLSAKTGEVILRKRKWTPNGEALPVETWADNGAKSYPSWMYAPRSALWTPLFRRTRERWSGNALLPLIVAERR